MFIQLCATATHVKFQVQWRFHKIGACQSCSAGESRVFGGLEIIFIGFSILFILAILMVLMVLIILIIVTLAMVMFNAIHRVTFIHAFNVEKGHVMI